MAGTTGREPNNDTSVILPAIIGAKTGFTPDPTAMTVDIGAIRTGRKAIVVAGIGQRSIAMAEIGARVVIMASIGTSIEIIAITPGAMHRMPVITDMAGITTGTRRATA